MNENYGYLGVPNVGLEMEFPNDRPVCDLSFIAIVKDKRNEVEVLTVKELNEKRQNLFLTAKELIHSEFEYQTNLDKITHKRFCLELSPFIAKTMISTLIKNKMSFEEQILEEIDDMFFKEKSLSFYQQTFLIPFNFLELKEKVQALIKKHQAQLKEI